MTVSVKDGKEKLVVWPYWLAAVEVFLLSTVSGMVGGWTSPYLAKLTSSDAALPITEAEASWIAAILNIGRLGGVIFGALIVEYFGTKVAVLWTGIPHALGWTLLIFADSVWWVYMARILGGIGIGMYYSTFPLYMGEISSPKIRGALVAFIAQGMSAGMVLGNILGAYTSMSIFAWISLVPTLAFLALFMIMPASPYYLIRQNRLEDAKKSLEWYNRGVDVSSELNSLQEFISSAKPVTDRDKLGQLFAKDNRKAVVHVTLVFVFIQLSGLWTLSFYMEIILKNARVTVIEPSVVVIIVGVVGIVFGWASMWMNDKYGRKIMFIISCLGVACSYVLLGMDYQLLGDDVLSENVIQWLPIVSIILFQCAICVGITSVPTTLMSEMFSPNVKSTATCVVTFFSSLSAFLSSKMYQPLVDLTGEQYVFWLYGLMMSIVAMYDLIFIPETKGKSLQEIQCMLTQKKVNVDKVRKNAA